MKHLKTFNESVGEIAGKKPSKLADDIWAKIKKGVNNGYVTNYEMQDTSHADRKTFIISCKNGDEFKTELLYKGVDKHRYDNKINKTVRKTVQEWILPSSSKFLYEFTSGMSKYLINSKRDNSQIIDNSGNAHPFSNFQTLIKDNEYYKKLINDFEFEDTTTLRQLKLGSLELSHYNGFRILGKSKNYVISKGGKVYNHFNRPPSTIFTLPPLSKVSDYEKCLKFIYEKEVRAVNDASAGVIDIFASEFPMELELGIEAYLRRYSKYQNMLNWQSLIEKEPKILTAWKKYFEENPNEIENIPTEVLKKYISAKFDGMIKAGIFNND
jgi:hypothetical protein